MKTLIRLLVVVTGLVLAMLVAVPAAMAAPSAECQEATKTLSEAEAAVALIDNDLTRFALQAATVNKQLKCATPATTATAKPHDHEDKCKHHDKDWDHKHNKCGHHHDKTKVYTQVKDVPVGPVDTGGGPA